MKQKILTLSNFKEGSLPVKYLGLHLISGKLASKVCKLLANKIAARINTHGLLEGCLFYGRLQLLQSVLFCFVLFFFWVAFKCIGKALLF